MSDRFLTIKAAAEFISVSVWTMRKYVSNRQIRSYKFGGNVRIRESDLLKFADVKETINEKAEKILYEDKKFS